MRLRIYKMRLEIWIYLCDDHIIFNYHKNCKSCNYGCYVEFFGYMRKYITYKISPKFSDYLMVKRVYRFIKKLSELTVEDIRR